MSSLHLPIPIQLIYAIVARPTMQISLSSPIAQHFAESFFALPNYLPLYHGLISQSSTASRCTFWILHMHSRVRNERKHARTRAREQEIEKDRKEMKIKKRKKVKNCEKSPTTHLSNTDLIDFYFVFCFGLLGLFHTHVTHKVGIYIYISYKCSLIINAIYVYINI